MKLGESKQEPQNFERRKLTKSNVRRNEKTRIFEENWKALPGDFVIE